VFHALSEVFLITPHGRILSVFKQNPGRHAELVVQLLEWNGVDPKATNCIGKTPDQVANHSIGTLVLDGAAADAKRESVGSNESRPAKAENNAGLHSLQSRSQSGPAASAGTTARQQIPPAGPTGRTWTAEQDHELREAVAKFGPGNWPEKAEIFSVVRFRGRSLTFTATFQA
jgi:hypothetical protein